ncbi:type II secretion system GspH family protein [Clostridium sardiniense]|uniref:Type II secretion system GspH family protein n=1 Tax=Clostridium sardiniense TaxID=29369 RepID=A0ABS7KV87_CLOSR|nr:type II secretion system protein [Clostridium sardiniense]MBY0754572.1 type II secretion system GspH family protein [Clostridium sardiniense]MDQ0460827.1 prepilin-type N-terminal cleavage/methylation domain-containing protein [Clostridium sardiniense]
MKEILKKKKKGFTLIELIAVVAIIGILASVLVPKINGYMQEAKKTKVMDQSRKVLLAVESYNMKNDKPVDINNTNTVDTALSKASIIEFIDPGKDKATVLSSTLDKLPSGMKLEDCKLIVEDRKDFTLKNEENGKKDIFDSMLND